MVAARRNEGERNIRPVRLSVQDTSLSRWQGGFNSRTGHSGEIEEYDQVVQLVDTRRSERRALRGLGVRLSPWSLQVGQVSDSLS